MQSLSKAMAGDACTVKWMFGVPELLRYLRANHIEEGKRDPGRAELLGKYDCGGRRKVFCSQ